MTKNDIVLKIASETDMRQTDVKQVVQRTFDHIIDALASEGRLELRNFGVFEVRNRKARKARNPRTGEQVMVPETRVVTFKAGKRMDDIIGGLEVGPAEPEEGNVPSPTGSGTNAG